MKARILFLFVLFGFGCAQDNFPIQSNEISLYGPNGFVLAKSIEEVKTTIIDPIYDFHEGVDYTIKKIEYKERDNMTMAVIKVQFVTGKENDIVVTRITKPSLNTN